MKDRFKKVRKLIEQSSDILITTHLIPDADAIGSEMAMYEYLTGKGKKVTVINHSETPEHLQFLDPNNIIKRYRDNAEEYSVSIRSADLVFLLDTNEYSRTKSMEQEIRNSKAKKVCIDHHMDINGNGFDEYISATDYPATSQLLYDMFADENPDIITAKVAEPLYAGIMTDTGSFRYPRTTSVTFDIAADLVRRGADPVHIYDTIYNNIPTDKVKLLARFINSLTFHFDGKVTIGIVTQTDFEEYQSDVKDVEGFSAFLMSMKGVEAGFLIVELRDSIKISFRSKGEIKVNEFAKKFGGGGHKNAAGASIEKTDVEELKEKLLEEYESFMNSK